jgi:hypothetical protein
MLTLERLFLDYKAPGVIVSYLTFFLRISYLYGNDFGLLELIFFIFFQSSIEKALKLLVYLFQGLEEKSVGKMSASEMK